MPAVSIFVLLTSIEQITKGIDVYTKKPKYYGQEEKK
jgi:hypothetical protein